VGALIENLPHTHFTIVGPRIGILEIRLVITVAAQNDICPHGRMYPKNADVIVRMSRIVPEFQVSIILNERAIKFFDTCQYIIIKKKEAPCMWIHRRIHPVFTFREIWTTL